SAGIPGREIAAKRCCKAFPFSISAVRTIWAGVRSKKTETGQLFGAEELSPCLLCSSSRNALFHCCESTSVTAPWLFQLTQLILARGDSAETRRARSRTWRSGESSRAIEAEFERKNKSVQKIPIRGGRQPEVWDTAVHANHSTPPNQCAGRTALQPWTCNGGPARFPVTE